MTIANCRRCGKLFNRVRRDICPDCIAQEEQAYTTVREYLRKHPEAALLDLSEATGVDPDIILEMIRDGRLIVKDHPNLYYTCERCGAPARSGRYCPRCAEALQQELQHASRLLADKVRETRFGHGYFISKEDSDK